MRDGCLELRSVLEVAEVESLILLSWRCEDGSLLGEVAIVRIVQCIFDEVAHEHTDVRRWSRKRLGQVIGSDEWIGNVFLGDICRKRDLRIEVELFLVDFTKWWPV